MTIVHPSAVAKCPNCAAMVRPLRIAYGMPGHELFEAAERGELVLGGCVIGGYDPMPSHRCPACAADLVRVGRSYILPKAYGAADA